MAGMGPAPKANRQRRNADTFTGERTARCLECGTPKAETGGCPYCGTPRSDAADGPRAPGPRIVAPDLPTPKKWLTATRDWWDAWTRSAQTSVFEPSDWETLKALLPLVDAMHRENADPLKRAKLFDAVHKAERGLGGTHVDRLRARINASDGGPGVAVGQSGAGRETPEGVAVLDEYREMLG